MHQNFRPQSQIVAYHEAGHAVMAMALGFSVSEISCIATETSRGHTVWHPPSKMTQETRIGAVLVYAAGMAADYLNWKSEEGRDKNEFSLGHDGDRRNAAIHLAELGQHDAFDIYVAIAIRHLRTPEIWSFVVSFAQILEKIEAINGQDVLLRAKERVPKISSAELLQFKEVADLRAANTTD
ncbi:hypothetical protein GO496_11520 [Acidovorax citrulli]|nr:hypothetical protein [Paracidovorax citrulli]